MFKKANLPYLVASSLATLTLILSLVLAVTSQVPFPLILALATLSVLVIALSCRAISSNKRMEIERSKFAEKEQKLENKISLEKEAGEAANKKVGELKDRLNELMKEKQGLESKIERLNEEIVQLKIQLESEEELYDKSEEKGEEKNEELEKKITKEIEYLKSCLNMTSQSVDLHKQNEKHSSENSNIDRVLFDQFLKAEKKHSGHIDNLEETLNILEQILLQGNVVQKAANSLEITTKGLSSELLSELKGTGKNTSASKQFPKPKPLPNETSRVEEDPGYVSRCSTPVGRY
ncbi:coiled-coil domain-containing protein [Wolbachia endosymbiont of Cimex lectularius]|uniref:hypothetical protein n=1 Tax=Wolbachia endosymbiont of Cimex lectularius TaxID=246273 RepID=UPI0011AEAA15|nr:hypothetical protein [Wolbachia endosymbiont of Cimex lectularius]